MVNADVALRGALGGGVDLVRAEPYATGDAALLALAPARVSPLPTVHASVDVRVRLSAVTFALLGVAADLDLEDTHYTFSRGGEGGQVFHPWRVRPIVFAGIALERAP